MNTHIHLVGGPDDGNILEIDFEDESENENVLDYLPDMIIIPTNQDEGELYEYSKEKASCGACIYLYSGYRWESLLPFRKPKRKKHR